MDTTVKAHAVIAFFCGQSCDPADQLADLGIDSLGVVSLQVELEDAFGVTFDDGEWTTWKTVADVVLSIKTKLGET